MANAIPTRDEAMALLREFNQGEGLVRHALAVEAVMRHMARNRGADPDVWGIVGLIHDLDYEQFPDQHCAKTAEILRDRGWPEEFIRAAVSHGWGTCSDVEPQTDLEKVLFAIDELTGLVAATPLAQRPRYGGQVRPEEMEGQGLRGGRQPRRHRPRRRAPRRRPAGTHHRRYLGHADSGRGDRTEGQRWLICVERGNDGRRVHTFHSRGVRPENSVRGLLRE